MHLEGLSEPGVAQPRLDLHAHSSFQLTLHSSLEQSCLNQLQHTLAPRRVFLVSQLPVRGSWVIHLVRRRNHASITCPSKVTRRQGDVVNHLLPLLRATINTAWLLFSFTQLPLGIPFLLFLLESFPLDTP